MMNQRHTIYFYTIKEHQTKNAANCHSQRKNNDHAHVNLFQVFTKLCFRGIDNPDGAVVTKNASKIHHVQVISDKKTQIFRITVTIPRIVVENEGTHRQVVEFLDKFGT
ncbi:hypothetical protein Zmor_002576 [Zophobas morio]|uniref:Uncharacterized protein n=1 Tax=Zophobas morio TaxID=2755281 RepID=A0AA38MTX0_9CUCU|nr:hypothetical protein Zmor_002576 [Zophobas morio]